MPRLAIQNVNASPYFNSSSMSIASSASLAVIGDATNRNYTVGFWYKASPNLANNTNILTKGTFYSINFRNFTGTGEPRLSFGLYDGTANPRVAAVNATNDNTWKFIVGTRSNNTIKLYVNGVLVASQTTTTGDTSSASTVNSSSGLYSISKLFITLNTMTATEILNMYNSGRLDYTTVLNLPLSEGAGTIAYDTSGNANDGTITSPTWTRDAPSKTRKTVNNNLVYNGDFEIAPVVNVPQTTGYKWYDGTTGGNGSGTASVNTNRTTGIYFWDKGGSGSILLDDTVKKSGSYSLKLSTTATGSFTTASLADFNRDDYIPVLPSTNYTYSLWMKTNYVSGDATSGAGLNFRQFTGARTFVSSGGVSPIKTTTDWTLYTGTVTTAATTRFVAILPYVLANDGAATLIMDAWFDDITLTPTTATTRTANTFPQRKTPDNLLSNGNFEYAPPFTAATNTTSKWIDGTAAGSSATSSQYDWAIPAGGISALGNVQYDTTVSYSGNNSIKLTTLDSTCLVVVGKYISLVTAKSIPCLPSTSYTFSAMVKTSGGGNVGAYLRIRDLTGSGSSITTNSSSSLLGVNEWTRLSITFTTASTARFLAPILVFDPNVAAFAWFDDITLTKVPADARTVVS